MGGESGTSHMGNTYYYYKCGNAKRHGKAHCDLKAIRKEPLERFVVETAIKVIFSDEIIERLIDLVMDAQQQENTRLPVLKDQLRDCLLYTSRFRTVILWMRQAHSHSSGNSTDEAV